jgi:AraC-like DNA-binding protein
VRAALGARDCSAAAVAALLSMHPRTLSRRLQAEGTTFRAIVEAVRRETAEQLLVYTAMPNTEIADALAYADPAVFTRAFRRWTGQPPSRWRAGRTG